MASSLENPSIIEEYSQTFTGLQAGKRELISWGAEATALNRYIVDAAADTGDLNPASILQAIDVNKVSHGDTHDERTAYCETALKKLISLQEEVSVLQKSAREKGISGGLLTIIGQAASQSPEDNGASVLRQLTDLVQGDESENTTALNEPESPPESHPDTKLEVTPLATNSISLDGNASNDVDRLDLERMTGLQLLGHTLVEHWKPLVIDASVCAIAASIAISLIN